MGIVAIYTLVFRFAIIILGLVAMWSMWTARELRGKTWAKKLRDIWKSHMLLITACVMGNFEFVYRKEPPTIALWLVFFGLIYAIKGTFSGSQYIKGEDDNRSGV